MKLIDPGPGELLDRETILELKIEHGQRQSVSTAVWEEELDGCQEAAATRFAGWVSPVVQEGARALKLQLADVNRKLWDCIDEVHRLPDPSGYHGQWAEAPSTLVLDVLRLADLAKLITFLNDQRADLIRQINKLFEIETHEKKLYA